VNLLHYDGCKLSTYFGRLLWLSSGLGVFVRRVFYKGNQTNVKYKIQWSNVQRTNTTTEVFINKIRMLQRTTLQRTMLQRTNAKTNSFLSIKSGCYNEREGIESADVARACSWLVGPSPLSLQRQSSSFLLFVRFSYQFSSVICLSVQCI